VLVGGSLELALQMDQGLIFVNVEIETRSR